MKCINIKDLPCRAQGGMHVREINTRNIERGPGSAVGVQFLAVYPVLTGGGVQNSFSLDAASLTDFFGDLGQSFIRAAGCLGGNDGAGGQREKQGVFLPVKIKHHLTRCHGNNLPDWCTEQDDRLIPISPRRYSLDASPTQKDGGQAFPLPAYRIPSRANFLRCARRNCTTSASLVWDCCPCNRL